ncbi:hypothetical protein AAHN97_13405 [Chitinophaga niabensis]|uniref:hypothetical protein n=1 Tax=Chitinophaga niabensis TaxID=536979 RepID=UPI0031BB1385
MKKILALLSCLLLLCYACSRKTDDLPVEKQKPELLATTSSTYEDDYPEWGTTGTNWPAQSVNETYSPMPQVYRSFRILNNIEPLLGSSGYSLTPYFHVQWRKVYPNGAPMSRWYNYHPTIPEYTALRIDTLPGVFLPGSIYWQFDLSSGMMPQGNIQVRARMLLSPTTESDRASATLWSTDNNFFDNIFGYSESGGPGGGQQVSVNIDADIEVLVNNPTYRYYDYLELSALGRTQTFYPPAPLSGTISMRVPSSTNATYDQSKIHNYTATVTAFLGNGTKVASYSKTFSNIILVNSSMGSNPTVYFDDYMEFNIPAW